MKWVPAGEGKPRTIEIYCGERSCVDYTDEVIANLQSFYDGGYEIWTVVAGGEHQRIIHRNDVGEDPDALEQQGLVAHRFKLVCPRCGYDITAGDLLGMGVRAMAHQRGGRREPRDQVAVPPLAQLPRDHVFAEDSVYYSPARQEVMAALSKVADYGVSRLSLAALDRMLAM